jgi:hypothetical protein
LPIKVKTLGPAAALHPPDQQRSARARTRFPPSSPDGDVEGDGGSIGQPPGQLATTTRSSRTWRPRRRTSGSGPFPGRTGPLRLQRQDPPGDADTVEAARAKPDSVARKGSGDVTNHYAKIIDGLSAQPILICHSFGSLIAEKLLGMDCGAAAIAIDASQNNGVLQLLHHRGIG